ncbi:polysaccharide biosynthesis protein [Aurantibacillus circumpalustris]|uniref:polysaccharide biosynthesis protein n=1 Tax=Aurantibacillus circumpalustris TaxID=3036359 RepID=UPI00295C1582|nr:nucleoside-diphosphate sugar epimerase/dehydratase [Aurantibacillus circumpalustris]
MYRIFKLFWQYNLPRWSILIIDTFICAFALSLAFVIRFDFSSIPINDAKNLPYDFIIVLGIRFVSFAISKTYKGVVRYTSTRDTVRIFTVVVSGSVIVFIINLICLSTQGFYFIPNSVLIIDALVSLFLMISSRLTIKALYFEIKNPAREKMNVIIYGAGESGIITKRTLDRDAAIKYNVVGFIDDDEKKHGRSMEGVFVYGLGKLQELISQNGVEFVIISIQKISIKKKNHITDICLDNNVRVLNVPPASKWINGELSFNQIKSIRIEDLLEREPIQLDTVSIQAELKNKIILITGAAGSIGSELARQCAKFGPKKLYLLDQSESPLHELDLEFSDRLIKPPYEVIMADVRNYDRMKNVFNTFKPQIVFHAAAYKHVPMMENNPSESILTNILGTKTLADLSNEFNVERFVFVSTDKAVNPTNVMGASKRIAEIYIQSLGKNSTTKFITTRFGNVLGSNGSVIPRFKKQIEQGGPITITHPEITRYFMTIPEASQLVLEASAMGKGGEIFVFDMGDSIKIVDLARKMILLVGMKEGKDISIVYTGLRPGEKLYEELLANNENTLPTHHSQILIGKVREYEYADVKKIIEELIKTFDTQDNELIVQRMKDLVPEYISNNSIFQKLD